MSATVKILIFKPQDASKLLLVHERGDGTPIGKPSGWGMPGGGVRNEETETDAAVRETLEETGLAINVREIFRESFKDNHQVIIFEGFIVGGILRAGHKQYAPEIDRCAWFFCDELPDNGTQSGRIYYSERNRIEKAIAILRRKEYEEGYLQWFLSAGKEVLDGNRKEIVSVNQRGTGR